MLRAPPHDRRLRLTHASCTPCTVECVAERFRVKNFNFAATQFYRKEVTALRPLPIGSPSPADRLTERALAVKRLGPKYDTVFGIAQDSAKIRHRYGKEVRRGLAVDERNLMMWGEYNG